MKLWHVVAGAVGLGALYYLVKGQSIAAPGTSVAPNHSRKPAPAWNGTALVPPLPMGAGKVFGRPAPVVSAGPSVEAQRGAGHF